MYCKKRDLCIYLSVGLSHLGLIQFEVVQNTIDQDYFFIWVRAVVLELQLIGASELIGLGIALNHLHQTEGVYLSMLIKLDPSAADIGVYLLNSKAAGAQFEASLLNQ